MQARDVEQWDAQYDVVVVGSGNGALTAAIVACDGGSSVLVIEKAPMFGGTSASSGGGVWIPNNRYALQEGADDSFDDARAYLDYVSPEGKIDPSLLETYVSKGPETIQYLHEKTSWVRYTNLAHYPDYFPEAPAVRPAIAQWSPSRYMPANSGTISASCHASTPRPVCRAGSTLPR